MKRKQPSLSCPKSPIQLERLEDRRLLSGSHGFGGFAGANHRGFSSGSTIEFSQLPQTIQTGLTTLAATDNVTAPTATETVFLGNSNGVETFTVDVNGTGTQTRLTVDQNGDPVTAPTLTTTTFGEISNAAVTDEITAIASGLGLTAPTAATVVTVSTPTSGAAIYTANLDPSDTTTASHFRGGRRISVDADGNPVGQEQVPLSALSSTIQGALNSNAPSSATALTASSLIDVRTLQGVTFYTATFTSSGTTTKVSVTAAGALTSLPSSSDVEFSTIPSAAKAALQTLATADGYTGTIPTTQTVTAYAEANGNTIYSVTLAVTDPTTGSTSTVTSNITLSVDQLGNPAVPPRDRGGRGDCDNGGFGRRGFGGRGFGGRGGDDDDSSDPTTTTTTTTSNGTTSTPAATAAQIAKERKAAARAAKKAAKAERLVAKLAAKAAARALNASRANA